MRFTDAQRHRLAVKGKALGRKVLRAVATMASPDTILGWHRRLVERVARREHPRRTLGRPMTPKDIAKLVLRMARENSTWGYSRIHGALRNLGQEVSRSTIASILNTNGLDPAPQRGKQTSWAAFLKAHWETVAATDFFTTYVWTPRALVAYYVVFFIELATRRVEVVVLSNSPDEKLMLQVGREITNPFDGFLRGKQYLIMDRDAKYSAAFRRVLNEAGIETIVLPYRAPNMNAHAERFVRSIKDECLRKLIFIGEASLRRAVHEYLAHYHGERNHQGLANRLIEPPRGTGANAGTVVCRKRLGGLLKFYYRSAA